MLESKGGHCKSTTPILFWATRALYGQNSQTLAAFARSSPELRVLLSQKSEGLSTKMVDNLVGQSPLWKLTKSTLPPSIWLKWSKKKKRIVLRQSKVYWHPGIKTNGIWISKRKKLAEIRPKKKHWNQPEINSRDAINYLTGKVTAKIVKDSKSYLKMDENSEDDWTS